MNTMREFYEGRKVLVTGGAGFVGSHLCEALLAHGAEVHCIDNLSAGKISNVSELMESPRFHFVQKDVRDRDEEMEALFDGASVVFHNAASKKNICLDHPDQDLDVNAGGTLNLLRLSVKQGIDKFVHASTGSVYGEPRLFPTDEAHPFEPVSYYGVSKLAGERYVDVFHKLHAIDTTILRYFHVYGPRQESNEFGGVVSIFLRRIQEGKNPVVFGDGKQVRSFTWVSDLVRVNLLCPMSGITTGQAYNVASGIRVSIEELAQRMIALSGRSDVLRVDHGPPLLGDIHNFEIDNGKVVKDLGVTFNCDFWGTLEDAVRNSRRFLGQ